RVGARGARGGRPGGTGPACLARRSVGMQPATGSDHMRCPAPLAIAALFAIGCSAAEDADPGADGGAHDESGYDLGEGTGAGEDDGDGPDDDIPNEEDAIDTEPGPDD